MTLTTTAINMMMIINSSSNSNSDLSKQRAGCDNRLGSSAKYDSCGVCGGDNSQCRQVSEQFAFTGKMTYGKPTLLYLQCSHYEDRLVA